MSDYHFRTDRAGTYCWSGETNYCTVPGCMAVTVTIGSQAKGRPADGVASRYPLAVAALGRRKERRYWAWPMSAVLLAMAVMGLGASVVQGKGRRPGSS